MANYSQKCFPNKRYAFMLYKTTKHIILFSYCMCNNYQNPSSFFFFYKSETFTFFDLIKWVEECHQEVEQHSELKGDAAPEGHVTAKPGQVWIG